MEKKEKNIFILVSLIIFVVYLVHVNIEINVGDHSNQAVPLSWYAYYLSLGFYYVLGYIGWVTVYFVGRCFLKKEKI